MAKIIEFDKNSLDDQFWIKYSELWNNAIYKSSFYGPNFLKQLIEVNTNSPLFLIAVDKSDNFIASMALKSVNGVHQFLSTGQSDHNPLIFHKTVEDIEQQQNLVSMMVGMLKGNIFLKNLPTWTDDVQLIQQASKVAKLHYLGFPAWKCPMVEYTFDQEKTVNDFFKDIFKKSRLQTYFNKIKRMDDFKFEIEDKETADLRTWADEFCFNHEMRWDGTPTPSMFISKFQRDLFYKKLVGWHRDGVCYRFTISAEGRKLAMVVGLTEGKRLIYCLPSYAMDYEDTHAASVLVSQMGLWVGENGYNVFDFGVGTEDYKFRYSNTVKDVYRVYITSSTFSIFYLKGLFDRFIRLNKKAETLWEKYGLGFFRGNVGKIKTNLKVKISIQIKDTKQDLLSFPKKLLRKFKPVNEYYYLSDSVKSPIINEDGFEYRKLSLYETLDFLQSEIPMTPTTRERYINDFVKKKRIPYGLFVNNDIVQVSWLKIADDTDIPKGLQVNNNSGKLLVILDCYTALKHRGKGYYGKVLNYLRTLGVDSDEKFIIYTDYWNKASQKGIEKAGFIKVAEKIRNNNNVEWKTV